MRIARVADVVATLVGLLLVGNRRAIVEFVGNTIPVAVQWARSIVDLISDLPERCYRISFS